MTFSKLNNTAARILDTLTADMPVGSMRRLVDASGTYMDAVVERLTENTFSVAHRFEQNGDLVPDPDMAFVRLHVGPAIVRGRAVDLGMWAPINCTHATGTFTEALTLDAAEGVATYRPRALADLAAFANMWMRNISRQHDLRHLSGTSPPPPSDGPFPPPPL